MTEPGTPTSERPRRERHPLLHAFPLTVLSLATFLVVFTMMMANLKGAPTALAPGGSSPKVAVVNGKRLVVTTTPSGRVLTTGAPAAAGGSPAVSGTHAIVTSSSGARATDD